MQHALRDSMSLHSPGRTQRASIKGRIALLALALAGAGAAPPALAAPPNAVDDFAVTRSGPTAGLTVEIDVLANDTDPDGDLLQYVNVNYIDGSHGTVSRQNGLLAYTPDAGYVGPDQFSYEVDDGTGELGSAFVNITVNADTDPVAVNDSYQLSGFPNSIQMTVLANDSDPDGDPLDYKNISFTQPAHGFVDIGCVGNCNPPTYQPAISYEGPDSFTYTIDDGLGGKSTATVNITVTKSAGAPTAAADSASTVQNQAVSIDVLANDVSGDGSPLTINSASQPANGSVIFPAGASVTYTPNAGFVGQDTFTYTVTNDLGSDTATVTVDVAAPPNQPPQALDDEIITLSYQPVVLNALLNDSDPDGDPLTIIAIPQPPQSGTAAISADGKSITYTPVLGVVGIGIGNFTYQISDGRGGTATAGVSVEIQNSPPLALEDSVQTGQDTAVSIDVLVNDSDPDGDALTVIAINLAPGNGTAVVDPNGQSVTYTPNAGYVGNDSFQYTIHDVNGASAAAAVTVQVIDQITNQPPVAVNDIATTLVDTPVTIDVLANDSDPDGDPLSLSLTSPAAHGTVTDLGNGSIAYTPNAGFIGQEVLTYEIFDPSEQSATATITINVVAANAPPVAVDDVATTARDTAVAIAVLANDSDPDGDAIQVSDASAPAHGTTQASPNGVLYTPAAGYVGPDQFTYIITDSRGASASANVAVTVTAPPPVELPTAVIAGLKGLYPDTDGQPGETVTASGQNSTGIEGGIATYIWSVGDSEVQRGPGSDVTLDLPDGESVVTLVVIDQGGLQSDPVSKTVSVAGLSSNENLTPNQMETAKALEDSCSSLQDVSDPTPGQLQILETCQTLLTDASPAEVETALDALSGQQVTAAQTSGIDFSALQLTNIASRIQALRAGAHGVSVAGLNIVHDGKRIPLAELGSMVESLFGGGASGDDDEPGGLLGDRLGLFINGNYIYGNKDDSALEAGYDFDSIGVTLGADYRFTDQFVAGFAVGYGNSSSDFTMSRGKLDSDGYSGSVFGSFYGDSYYLDGILSYGQSNYDALRRIAFTSGGVQTLAEANGDTDGSTFGAGLSAGWDFTHGALTIGPNLAVSYVQVDVDGYTEKDAGGYNLTYDDQSGESLTVRAGGHLSYAISGKWGVISPQLRADFVKELQNDSQTVRARFAADPTSSGFVLTTDTPDKEYFVWGLGVAGTFANGLSAFFDYQTVSSLDLISSHEFTVGLRYQRSFK
jgi:uncharacterized protein YhjY with autotransporter beta-barrel domain